MYVHTIHGRTYNDSEGNPQEELVVHADIMPDGSDTRDIGRMGNSWNEIAVGEVVLKDIKPLEPIDPDDIHKSHLHAEVYLNLVPDTFVGRDLVAETDSASAQRVSTNFNIGWRDAFWQGIYGQYHYFAQVLAGPSIASTDLERAVMWFDGTQFKWKKTGGRDQTFGGVDFGSVAANILPSKTAGVTRNTLGWTLGGTDKIWQQLYVYDIRGRIHPDSEGNDVEEIFTSSLIPNSGGRRLGSSASEPFNEAHINIAKINDIVSRNDASTAQGDPDGTELTTQNLHVQIDSNLVPQVTAGSDSEKGRLGLWS